MMGVSNPSIFADRSFDSGGGQLLSATLEKPSVETAVSAVVFNEKNGPPRGLQSLWLVELAWLEFVVS